MSATIVEFAPTEQAALDELLAAGGYRDATDVLSHGLHLIKLEQTLLDEQAARLAHLQWERAEVQKGWDLLDAGDYIEIHSEDEHREFMNHCMARARELVATGQVKPSR